MRRAHCCFSTFSSPFFSVFRYPNVAYFLVIPSFNTYLIIRTNIQVYSHLISNFTFTTRRSAYLDKCFTRSWGSSSFTPYLSSRQCIDISATTPLLYFSSGVVLTKVGKGRRYLRVLKRGVEALVGNFKLKLLCT